MMSKKVGRNDPCPCGSGKKYKKCCLHDTETEHTDPLGTITQFCNLLKWSLEQYPFDSHQKIRVKSVKLLNNMTLSCEFYPYAQKSIDIKTEICGIMAFMSSFSRENPWAPSSVEHFAVSAYTEGDEEILYAISSKETAALSGEGRSIEWLTNTLFQDNSEDFRQTRAKIHISEIENALRKVVCNELSKVHGASWWSTTIDSKIRNSAEYVYENQTGVPTTDGEKLISYTYLLQLKTIISQNWTTFLPIFPDKVQFENWIDELNLIRRDEAHNRPITIASIKRLDQIYDEILEPIAQCYPELVRNYLTENWRIQLQKILESYSGNFQPLPTVTHPGEYHKSIAAIKSNIRVLADTETQLASVIIPPGKKELHHELASIFREMKESVEDAVENFEHHDIHGFREAAERYQSASERIPKCSEKILASM